MDGLRWLLLLLGALVVAGVYLYSRRERDKTATQDLSEERVAPTFGAENNGEEIGADVDTDAEDSDDGAVPAQEMPQKIVTLRLVAKERGAFAGDELILSLRGIGMRHGKFGIFHRYEGADDNNTVFSAASLIEPGSFDLANIKDQKIPGISLFLVLPGPVEGAEAFDMMMATARTLAQSLNADLLDESGSNLSIQRERYMREEIIQFQHSNLSA